MELKYLLASLKQIKHDLEVIKINSQMLDQRNAAVLAVQKAQELAWSDVYDLMCHVENALDEEKRAAQEATA